MATTKRRAAVAVAAATAPVPERRVRVVRLPLRAAALGGGVAGFVVGLFAGAGLGALLTWLSGTVLTWQQHLAFTLGVTTDLLPLGDQVGRLQTLEQDWWLVIPLTALAVGLPLALSGALGMALLAALFNRFGPALQLTVDEVVVRAPRPQ